MREPFEKPTSRITKTHRYAWVWEVLESDPTFVLRPMFGGKSVYLDGKLMGFFVDKNEPWRGMLVCTDHAHHEALVADFPELNPHPVLPKWLYLPESADSFERTAVRLMGLARRRDPRIGVIPQPKKKRVKNKVKGSVKVRVSAKRRG